MPERAFQRGDIVRKRNGSAWEGRVCGEYSTSLTPEGYAVESSAHPGSVQIYPAAALALVASSETPAAVRPNDGFGVCYPERASACGLAECSGKPMCERCALASGTLLKPCPWCWTEGDELFDLLDRFDAGHVAHVHCTHCGADGPSCYSETSANDAIKQARQRWNSRMVASHKTPNAELSGPPA